MKVKFLRKNAYAGKHFNTVEVYDLDKEFLADFTKATGEKAEDLYTEYSEPVKAEKKETKKAPAKAKAKKAERKAEPKEDAPAEETEAPVEEQAEETEAPADDK